MTHHGHFATPALCGIVDFLGDRFSIRTFPKTLFITPGWCQGENRGTFSVRRALCFDARRTRSTGGSTHSDQAGLIDFLKGIGQSTAGCLATLLAGHASSLLTENRSLNRAFGNATIILAITVLEGLVFPFESRQRVVGSIPILCASSAFDLMLCFCRRSSSFPRFSTSETDARPSGSACMTITICNVVATLQGVKPNIFLMIFRSIGRALHPCNMSGNVTDMNMPDRPEGWADYLKAITNNASGIEIARKTGFATSTISRWLHGITRPNARQVERVARVYGVKVSDALTIAGHLQSDPDAEPTQPPPRGLTLREFTVQELAQEILRRAINEGDDDQSGDTPKPAIAIELAGTG